MRCKMRSIGTSTYHLLLYPKSYRAGGIPESLHRIWMGSYGIGLERCMAAIVEQHHDDKGIIWPDSMAPFKVAIIGLKLNKSEQVRLTCEKLYQELLERNVEVLFDDRDERPGVMFADMELIGIPHVITVGDRSLSEGMIEYKSRKTGEKEQIKVEKALEDILKKIA